METLFWWSVRQQNHALITGGTIKSAFQSLSI
jgi:hypothetical protein